MSSDKRNDVQLHGTARLTQRVSLFYSPVLLPCYNTLVRHSWFILIKLCQMNAVSKYRLQCIFFYLNPKVIQEINHFTKTAEFYWTMDNHQDIKNLVGNDWGRSVNGTVTIKGIKGNAVYIKAGASGRFTLVAGLSTSCLFDPSLCSNGFTLMLWLWFKHTAQRKVLLASHGGNTSGFQMLQMASSTPQVCTFVQKNTLFDACADLINVKYSFKSKRKPPCLLQGLAFALVPFLRLGFGLLLLSL